MNLAAYFHQHIERTSVYVLATLNHDDTPGLPSASEQEILFNTVQQGLGFPKAWSHVRRVLLALAPRVEQTALYPSWTLLLEEGLAASERHADTETTAHLRYYLGQIAYLRSEYDKAKVLLSGAAIGYAALNRPCDEAKCTNRLAYLARLQRRHDEAGELAQRALALLSPDDAERSYSYMVLGVIANDGHDWLRAVDHLQQALSIAQQYGSERAVAVAYGNLGPPLRELARYDEAIATYTEAITRLGALEDWDRQARYRMNLGNVYLCTDRYQEALDCYREAEAAFRRNNARTNVARIAMNSGQAYRGLKQWRQSEGALRAAAAQYREQGHIDNAVDALDELGLTYQAQGDQPAAAQAFAEALQLVEAMRDDVGYAARRQIVEEHCADLQRSAAGSP